MDIFPHLNILQKIIGRPRLFGGGSRDPRTEANRNDRQGHSNYLSGQTARLKQEWENDVEDREEAGLAPLSADIIPVFLQINPRLIDAGFELSNFEIEIISEEDDGFIIGASLDSLRTLEDKINGFALERFGSTLIGDLWDIVVGDREEWKKERVVSEELLAKWPDIVDTDYYTLEVSIAFDRPLKPRPDPTKRGGEKRLEKYNALAEDRDRREEERQEHFTRFIEVYGEITSALITLDDSFACSVRIRGIGLKDLANNYPFVFDITEIDIYERVSGGDIESAAGPLNTIAPDDGAPEIGIIDSGIMENHRFIQQAINPANSKSYIHGDPSTADNVRGGGHGTKVAGAILYPNGITAVVSPYQLPFFIRNLRVLDSDNYLTTKLHAELMKLVVDNNPECKIFNLSVCSTIPFRVKHMSSWAAMIDTLMFEKDILFVISSGNLEMQQIRYFLGQNDGYPSYLERPFCRLANPAQSSFALTVGSINHASFEDTDWQSMGEAHEVSPFTRIGLGIWNQTKPDLVEYGGGLIQSRDGQHRVREHATTSPELIRSTLHGGPSYGNDGVGTSFAAPKVTYVVAQLKKLYPAEHSNLLRALAVQGARLPGRHFLLPDMNSLRHFGYGLPSLDRVTRNTETRITFYNTGTIRTEEAHIYLLKLPDILLNPGDEYDVLIEITLTYSAKVRRTRQKTRSYLSTWLDWITSKQDESYDQFKQFVLTEIEGTTTAYDAQRRNNLADYPWKIGNRANNGIDEMARTNSTVQKDWAVIKSYLLTNELSFAVRGHKGWDKNKEEVPYAIAVSIEMLNVNLPIYEAIRIENEIEIPV